MVVVPVSNVVWRCRWIGKKLKRLVGAQSVAYIKYQSFCRRLGSIDAERSHTTHNGADEVDIEDGVEVDDVEQDGDA